MLLVGPTVGMVQDRPHTHTHTHLTNISSALLYIAGGGGHVILTYTHRVYAYLRNDPYCSPVTY